MVRLHLLQGRRLVPADIHRVRAARVEAAPARRVIERRRLAGDAHPLRLVVHLGQRADQVLRVGVARLLEDRPGVGLFHHLSGVKHGDAVGQVGVHAHIMGHHDEGVVLVLADFIQQLDHAALHHHVERGGRLVGQDELGREDGRQGDRHPLAHAAGKLVRDTS